MECVDGFRRGKIAGDGYVDQVNLLPGAGAKDGRRGGIGTRRRDRLGADYASALGDDEEFHWKVPISRLYFTAKVPLLWTATV